MDERQGPTLLHELVLKIITYRQHDRRYASLASMARANSTFYDLVIPLLYQTVTITETNKYKLKYGHGSIVTFPISSSIPDRLSGDLAVQPSCGRKMNIQVSGTRKGRAVEYFLRLIVDVAIRSVVGSVEHITEKLPHQCYGNVEEIVFTSRGSVYVRDGDILAMSDILPVDGPEVVLRPTAKYERIVIHHAPGHGDEEGDHRLQAAISRFQADELSRKSVHFAIYLSVNIFRYFFGHVDAECHYHPDSPYDTELVQAHCTNCMLSPISIAEYQRSKSFVRPSLVLYTSWPGSSTAEINREAHAMVNLSVKQASE